MFFVNSTTYMKNHISTIFVNNDISNIAKFNWIFCYNTESTHYSSIRINDGRYILNGTDGNFIYDNLLNKLNGGQNNRKTKKNKYIIKNKSKRKLKK